jgi:hypothetical protein
MGVKVTKLIDQHIPLKVTLPKSRINAWVANKFLVLRKISAICAFPKVFWRGTSVAVRRCSLDRRCQRFQVLNSSENGFVYKFTHYCAVLRKFCVVLTQTMRKICVEYQWSFAKMLPVWHWSTTFHWRLADIWRMFHACFTYV